MAIECRACLLSKNRNVERKKRSRKFEFGSKTKLNEGAYIKKKNLKSYELLPGTPKERLQLLRKAFAATMKDPEFVAEAEKSKFDATYVSGEEVEKYVANVLSVTPKAKELLDFLMVKPKT